MFKSTRGTLLALAAAAIVLTGISAAASDSDDLDSRIHELLELTGAAEMGVQIVDQLMEPISQALPQVPEEAWKRYRAKINPEELTAIVVPIYRKNFTVEELDAMLAFYRTPEGRSILAKMPVAMQESMVVGQQWGEKVAAEILRELQAEGYEVR